MPKSSSPTEIVCAAVRLAPNFSQLEPGEGLPSCVEVLLLTSTERYANTRQLPLICVPSSADTNVFVRDSLQCIIGTMLTDNEIVHLGDGAQPKASSKARRPLCLLILKNASAMEVRPRSRRAAAGLPAFYTLASIRQCQFPCGKQSFACVQRIVEWLAPRVPLEQLKLLFTQRNFAHSLLSSGGSVSAATKAALPSHSQVVVLNPLRAAGLQHHSMSDMCVRNPLWPSYRPGNPANASQATPAVSGDLPTNTTDAGSAVSVRVVCRVDWETEFAMHAAARHGDLPALMAQLDSGSEQRVFLCMERDGPGWMPLHYAAWYGHLEVARALLDRGCCPPNVVTSRDLRTPLHLCAASGHLDIVSLLLQHPLTDPHQRDAGGRSPQQLVLDLLSIPLASGLCSAELDKRLQKVSELLRNFVRDKQHLRITVHLMDGSTKSLILIEGADTTAQQLQNQMLLEMKFPPSSSCLFSFWICSKCFQLELMPSQKPLPLMQEWRSHLPSLVDWASSSELRNDEAKLFWRREVRLNVDREKQTQHIASLHLLFHEAYQNYIKSFYPCAEKDVLVLATLLLFIRQPTNDVRKIKSFLSSEKQLLTVIPSCMLKNQPSQWLQRLTERYRALCASHSRRSRDELEFRFLSMCWNLTVYGSWLFTAYINIKAAKYPVSVFVGINDVGVHILHGMNKTLLQSFLYNDILWLREANWTSLDIRLKNSNHSVVVLRSKQAALIADLMDSFVGPQTPK